MKSKGRTFTREDFESFLSTAPDQLKDWAQQRLAQFDEVHQETPEDGDDDDVDPSDLLPKDEEDEDDAEADTPKVSALERWAGASCLSLVLVTLLTAALVIIVQMAGRPQPEPTAVMPSNHPSVNASSLVVMDQAQKLDKDHEVEFRVQIEVDPTNVEARLKSGTPYCNAVPCPEVILQLQFVLDQDPGNLDAFLSIGAAEYKAGQYDVAEKHRLHIIELAPQRVGPWYSLGFLYMARTPADPARAWEAWRRMIEIDPGSNMVKEVTTHLNSLATSTTATSPGN